MIRIENFVVSREKRLFERSCNRTQVIFFSIFVYVIARVIVPSQCTICPARSPVSHRQCHLCNYSSFRHGSRTIASIAIALSQLSNKWPKLFCQHFSPAMHFSQTMRQSMCGMSTVTTRIWPTTVNIGPIGHMAHHRHKAATTKQRLDDLPLQQDHCFYGDFYTQNGKGDAVTQYDGWQAATAIPAVYDCPGRMASQQILGQPMGLVDESLDHMSLVRESMFAFCRARFAWRTSYTSADILSISCQLSL